MGHLRYTTGGAILSMIIGAFLPALCSAQSSASSKKSHAADQQDYVYRTTVRRVPVDVVVLDKQGNAVSGLKPEDFELKEDGKTQHVLSFDWFSGANANFVPPKLPALPANTFIDLPSGPERGPLYILYYDMVNTPEEDQMSFRQELLKFVDEAQPGTRIALFVNSKRMNLLQGFTTDHALLREAILRKGDGPHIPDVFLYASTYGGSDASAALSNLTYIAEYMNGIPGRKNLIWLASSFPIPVGPTLVGGGHISRASQGSAAGSVGANGGPTVLDLTNLLAESVKRTYSAMMQSQVALYPVSVHGVSGGSSFGGAADAMLDYENMDTIASATGGHAYYSDNHPRFLIEKAVEHGEGYYTLTYAPSNTKYDGSERQIEVLFAKSKNYTLTYRRLYYAISDDEIRLIQKKDALQERFLEAKATDTLYATIEHGAPLQHDLIFSAHLSRSGAPYMATAEQMQQLEDSPIYFRTRRKNKTPKPLTPVKLQKYVIDYGVIDPQLKALSADGKKAAVLEFAAAAYNSEGVLLNSILNEGAPTGKRSAKSKSEALFHAMQELEVPPGAAFIRLVVRNTVNNQTGALEVSLPLKPETQTAQSANAPAVSQ